MDVMKIIRDRKRLAPNPNTAWPVYTPAPKADFDAFFRLIARGMLTEPLAGAPSEAPSKLPHSPEDCEPLPEPLKVPRDPLDY